ncbi:MAG: adenine phosphoribosyltransferase [Candidatus Micrarchaeota archaeon]|nr:adenine phosphoribosyltransferase [Candidatus Micrarchaeota archaeon]
MYDETFIRNLIRDIPDYPKKGILFKDITPLLKDPRGFRMCIDELAERISGKEIDTIVGIDARGFIMGGALAYKLGLSFVPARKKGKLPYKSISRSYDLEYGTATLEMHEDGIGKGSRVLIVDDLLATGGTAEATAHLVEASGGKVSAIAFLVELGDLNGRSRLSKYDIISLLKF